MGIHDSYIGGRFLSDLFRNFRQCVKLKERQVIIGEANWGELSEDPFLPSLPSSCPKNKEITKLLQS